MITLKRKLFINRVIDTMRWRLGGESAETVEQRKDGLPFVVFGHVDDGIISQKDLNLICDIVNDTFKECGSSLAVDCSMGEFIPILNETGVPSLKQRAAKRHNMSGHYHNVDHLNRDDIVHVLQSELSLGIEQVGDNKVVITLMLGDKPVGQPIAVVASLGWYTDRGHGGGTYVSKVQLEVA